MIGQNFSLAYLIPLALERLRQNPLVAGELYEGDLLASVLRVQSRFWQQRPDLRQVVEEIVALTPSFPAILRKDLARFQQRRFSPSVEDNQIEGPCTKCPMAYLPRP